jgi:hypothetical protein
MGDLNKTLGAISYYKTADHGSFQEVLQEYYSRGLQRAALQKALGIGAAGVGLGLGARGILGLLNLSKRNVRPKEPYESSIIELEDEEEKEAFDKQANPLAWFKGLSGLQKALLIGSAGTMGVGGIFAPKKGQQALRSMNQINPFGSVVEMLEGNVAPTGVGKLHQLNPISRMLGIHSTSSWAKPTKFTHGVGGDPKYGPMDLPWAYKDKKKPDIEDFLDKEGSLLGKKAGLLDFLKGQYAETTTGVPWAMPAAVGAGAGGLYGGWKLMDYILDRRRESRLDEELEAAKTEYEEALHETAKEAADGSLASDLNQLYDNLHDCGEKTAASWPEISGQAAGVYGTGAGLGALLMALIGYTQGKKKQRRRLLERAQARRRREEYSRRPDPLFVRSNKSWEEAPTVADGASDAAPSLDETEDQLF